MDSNQPKIHKIGALALLLLLLISAGLLFTVINLKGQLASSKSINEALSSDLVKTRDKSGAETAQKELILSDYKTLKSIHASDSSEIGKLQKLVNKKTLSATIIKNVTTGTAIGTTTVSFGNNDSNLPIITNSNPCDTVYPEYTFADSTKWVDLKVKATKDSTHVTYKFFNEYDIIQEIKKTGHWPFRRSVPMVSVKNLNPYTETTALSSFAVRTPKTGGKIATIAGIAAALGFIAGLLIVK